MVDIFASLRDNRLQSTPGDLSLRAKEYAEVADDLLFLGKDVQENFLRYVKRVDPGTGRLARPVLGDVEPRSNDFGWQTLESLGKKSVSVLGKIMQYSPAFGKLIAFNYGDAATFQPSVRGNVRDAGFDRSWYERMLFLTSRPGEDLRRCDKLDRARILLKLATLRGENGDIATLSEVSLCPGEDEDSEFSAGGVRKAISGLLNSPHAC